MTDTPSNETVFDAARAALDALEEHGLAPNGATFEVLLGVTSGAPTKAKADFEALMSGGGPVTEAAIQAIHEKHFAGADVGKAVMAASEKMQTEIGSVMATLEAAGRNTRAYGEALEGASGQLNELNDPVALRSMVENLAKATQQMQAHSVALERRLQDTTSEVDQLRSNLEAVRKEAMTDALTGIANRKRFDEALRDAVDSAHQSGEPLALMLSDIDFFKRFNDTWGHQTGDQIIRFVAGALSRNAEPVDVVARYGGEEFAVIMPGASIDVALASAERIRQSVENKKLMRKSTNENLGNVTISCGVAMLKPGEDMWEFVERADENLYASKQAGRNRVTSDASPKAA